MHSLQGIKYVGVAIVYFCHDNKRNFIMAKRSEKARDENGKWDIGGGGLDFDLSVEETLKKEIKEEYCTDVLSHEFLGFRDVFRTHNGKKTHWIALDFKVFIDRKKVKIGEPDLFTDLQWFRLDNLPDDVHSQLPAFIDKYHDKLK
jgi:8-oxo-dGTP pyrophosphatase MutT (NUDIX family)